MYSRSRRRLFFCYIVATVLSSSTIIRYVRPATATDTRPGANKDNKNLNKGPSKRIVGGKDALEDRYPYFVSLQENLNGIHKCGGSLVAPDIIMTAAHCASKVKYAQVGKYYLNSVVGNTNSNSTTAEENENVTGTISSSISDYETFEVLNMTSHPLYDSGYSFSHDVLLLKLDRISKKQYIRINQNSNIPITSTITSTDITRDNNDKQLIVMGIGSLSFSKFGSSPQVLQETSLSFIPNRICRRSKDPDVEDNYQDLISDDMLCAFENSQDACQGKQS
ncbi:MAG: secreted trypsin-like serine protease [Bacillariaceae sp.]|jgi:secreted trypsin-like serine protease